MFAPASQPVSEKYSKQVDLGQNAKAHKYHGQGYRPEIAHGSARSTPSEAGDDRPHSGAFANMKSVAVDRSPVDQRGARKRGAMIKAA